MLGSKESIRSFILKNFLFDQNDGSLTDDTSFLEQGIIDSTGVLELVEWLETTFSIKIEDEELLPENLDSINRLVQFVAAKSN